LAGHNSTTNSKRALLAALVLLATFLLLLHFVAFEAVTVIYWAPSRHRYYLDPLLAIAACAILAQLLSRFFSRGDSRA